MSITYKFNNLQSLADHFENQAQHHRVKSTNPRNNRRVQQEWGARANELENVVHILRNTVIEEVKPQ